MKKIFFSLVALAALAACSKSEVAYDAPTEIGFTAVAGNITKAAVGNSDPYPKGLNMYVFAETFDNALEVANYIDNGEFKFKSTDAGKNLWGGANETYYWPNTQALHFAGYSKSGNASPSNASYKFTGDELKINGYKPTGTDNDLMYFPSTETKKSNGYKKDEGVVDVEMLHTCSWISFYVKGDDVTGVEDSKYIVESLQIKGIYETGDLTCTGTDVSWDYTTNSYPKTATSTVLAESSSISLANTNTTGAVMAETTPNNTVLLPQVPGKLEIVYSYISPAGKKITEKREGETALDLTLDTVVTEEDALERTPWLPGKHYIYTITIKASEILIAPTHAGWEEGDFGITVE